VTAGGAARDDPAIALGKGRPHGRRGSEGLMRATLRALWRILKDLPLVILSPLFLLLATLALLITDLLSKLAPRRAAAASTKPDTRAASIVIPNWNGADLLARYLPSVIAAAEQCP